MSGYDSPRWDDEGVVEGDDADDRGVARADGADGDPDAIERASENVFDEWPRPSARVDEDAQPDASSEPEPEPEWEEGPEPVTDIAPEPERPGDESELVDTEPDVEPEAVEGEPAQAPEPAAHGAWEHAPGELTVPPGFPVLEGLPLGERRSVGVVVGRFNGEVTTRLLESALDELTARGVSPSSVTVMPVPGAFELPLAAMALAKTRRFACVVALGCVIRGDTPHFDYVASEAASGLQLAAIETGVPVAFGVLTLDRADQAEARIEKGAEAVRTALEMADLFANLRAAAAR